MVIASSILDRVLVLEMVRVTEAAAIAAAKLIGRGDEKAADAAAVEAMRFALNQLPMYPPVPEEMAAKAAQMMARHWELGGD